MTVVSDYSEATYDDGSLQTHGYVTRAQLCNSGDSFLQTSSNALYCNRPGCTAIGASNYDRFAFSDDGGCTFPGDCSCSQWAIQDGDSSVFPHQMDSAVYCTKDGYTDCCYMTTWPHPEYGPYYMCNLIADSFPHEF